MRAVGLSDLDVATRAVLMRPREEWATCAQGLIESAHAADVWRKRTGSAHPNGGTGSLYAQAAMARPAPYNRLCDRKYCAALGEVLAALETFRSRHVAP